MPEPVIDPNNPGAGSGGQIPPEQPLPATGADPGAQPGGQIPPGDGQGGQPSPTPPAGTTDEGKDLEPFKNADGTIDSEKVLKSWREITGKMTTVSQENAKLKADLGIKSKEEIEKKVEEAKKGILGFVNVDPAKVATGIESGDLPKETLEKAKEIEEKEGAGASTIFLNKEYGKLHSQRSAKIATETARHMNATKVIADYIAEPSNAPVTLKIFEIFNEAPQNWQALFALDPAFAANQVLGAALGRMAAAIVNAARAKPSDTAIPTPGAAAAGGIPGKGQEPPPLPAPVAKKPETEAMDGLIKALGASHIMP